MGMADQDADKKLIHILVHIYTGFSTNVMIAVLYRPLT
jgi:hypothetical protein